MKKTILLFVLTTAIITTSCSDNTEVSKTIIYSLGITTFSTSGSGFGVDLSKIENYLEGLQIPPTVTFTGFGKSDEEATEHADEQARNATQKYLERIKVEDIEALGLHSNTSFRWAVARDYVYIHEFLWNMEEIE